MKPEKDKKVLTSVRGYTLVEIMVAMFIGLVIAALMLTTLSNRTKSYNAQTEISELQQTLLSTMDLMEQEIRLAGYNRKDNKDSITVAEEHKITFFADIDNDSSITLDGDPTNDNYDPEEITYTFEPASPPTTPESILSRKEGSGASVKNLEFATGFEDVKFEYLDNEGSVLSYASLANQEVRDQIRRIRVTIIGKTNLAVTKLNDTSGIGKQGEDRVRTVIRDIAPPNLAVTSLTECGTIVVTPTTPIQACDPPGEISPIKINTYDKDGNPTNLNDVVITADYDSELYQDVDLTMAADSILQGGVRDAETILYLKPGEAAMTAGTVIHVSAKWTPPDYGCYQRQFDTTIEVNAGDPCEIAFIDEASYVATGCDAPNCDQDTEIIVEVRDACGNVLPGTAAKFYIKDQAQGADGEWVQGLLDGSSALESDPVKKSSDVDGRITMPYKAPNKILSAANPYVEVFGLLENPGDSTDCQQGFKTNVKLEPCMADRLVLWDVPDSVQGCMNRNYPLAVRVLDQCNNPISFLTDVKVALENPVGATGDEESVSRPDGSEAGSSVIMRATGADTYTYRARYNTRTDDEDRSPRNLLLTFSQPDVPDPVDKTIPVTECTCELIGQYLPEEYCTRGLSLGCNIDGLIDGWLDEQTNKAKIVATQGDIEIRTGDDYSDGPYYPETTLQTPDSLGKIPIAIRNSTTPLLDPVTIRLEEYDNNGLLQCTDEYSTHIACSQSEINMLDRDFRPAITYDPYDPDERIYIELLDCNRLNDLTLEVTVTSSLGDKETVTLDENPGNDRGRCYYRNSTGLPITALRQATHDDGVLQVDPTDLLTATYTDDTGACCPDKSVDMVELQSFCMPVALYSGANGIFKGTAFKVHWGEVAAYGDITFTGQMKNHVPYKDRSMDVEDTTDPFGGNEMPDRWTDVYVTGTVNGDSSGSYQPFAADTPAFPNLFQNVPPEVMKCVASNLDYDTMKDFAIRNDVYYYAIDDDTMRKYGDTVDIDIVEFLQNAPHPFIFIDVINGDPLITGEDLDSGAYDAQFPTPRISGNFYFEGFLYLAGNLDFAGMGGTTHITGVKSPPEQDVDQPLFPPLGEATLNDLPVLYDDNLSRVEDLSLDVHINGSIYVKGYMSGNANAAVYGALGAERGFDLTGTPEIWYNYSNSRSCSQGICCSLKISPAETEGYPGVPIQFDVSGDMGGEITWSIVQNESGATIDSDGYYVPGLIIGAVDIVKVEELNGCRSASARVEIVCPPITISGPNSMTSGETATFSASGGTSPYTWSVLNPTQGTVDSVTGEVVAGDPGTLQLRVVDDLGCTGSAEVGIQPAVAVCETVFFDDFDGGITGNYSGSWSHDGIGQDDWQFGDPDGDCSDPENAYSGNNVMANDLGLSGWNGCYSTNVTNWVISPTIDMTGYTNAELTFYRWLNVRSDDDATLLINCGSGWEAAVVYSNVRDRSWQEITMVGVDDQCTSSDVQLAFMLETNRRNNTGGWNIDDIRLCGYRVP